MFGPNKTKAMKSFGELLLATLILYEAAPGNLVHLRITLLDVAENTDTWISDKSDAGIASLCETYVLSHMHVEINQCFVLILILL